MPFYDILILIVLFITFIKNNMGIIDFFKLSADLVKDMVVETISFFVHAFWRVLSCFMCCCKCTCCTCTKARNPNHDSSESVTLHEFGPTRFDGLKKVLIFVFYVSLIRTVIGVPQIMSIVDAPPGPVIDYEIADPNGVVYKIGTVLPYPRETPYEEALAEIEARYHRETTSLDTTLFMRKIHESLSTIKAPVDSRDKETYSNTSPMTTPVKHPFTISATKVMSTTMAPTTVFDIFSYDEVTAEILHHRILDD